MEEKAYDKFYETEGKHWWFVGIQNIALSLLEAYLPHQSPEKLRLLDVGCGTGLLSTALSRYGRVFGMDISPSALAYCRQRHRFALVGGDLAYLPFADESFSAIVGLDVLEHVEDDRRAVAELYRVSRPGGIIVLNVPAFRFLWSDKDVYMKHFRRYTMPELKTKLENAGFQILKMSYANSLLFPLILPVRLIQRGMKVKYNIDAELGITPGVNQILLGLMALEKFWVKKFNFPFGVSLFCVAAK